MQHVLIFLEHIQDTRLIVANELATPDRRLTSATFPSHGAGGQASVQFPFQPADNTTRVGCPLAAPMPSIQHHLPPRRHNYTLLAGAPPCRASARLRATFSYP